MTTNKYHVKNGTYNISVSKTGYNTVTRSVVISNADKTENISLDVTTYNVTVTGIIPGSRIDVSSNSTTVVSETISTETSKQFSVNHGQSYTIVLTKDGSEYKRWANQTFTADATLSSGSCMLEVKGTGLPSGTLTVKRDGTTVDTISNFNGQSTVYKTPGNYTFEFTATGYRTQSKTYNISQGQSATVTFSGTDSYFVLTLNVTPNDAIISVKDSAGNSVSTF